MWFDSRLACPDCRSSLGTAPGGFYCQSDCGWRREAAQPIDLRPLRPRPVAAALGPGPDDPEARLRDIELTPPPALYRGPSEGRDSRELLSEIMRLGLAPGAVLELGCGPRDQAARFAFLGCDYVGLDVGGSAPDIIGDAHFPPFGDGAFDIVFAYAVLEHLHNPLLAMWQAARLLRPGGAFVGTVSLGEPFHSSYFHLTPWGLLALADFAGLRAQRLWPGPDTLAALADMGRYPRAIRAALRGVDALHRRAPALAPRRMRWPETEKRLDSLYRAGSLCFSLQKPVA